MSLFDYPYNALPLILQSLFQNGVSAELPFFFPNYTFLKASATAELQPGSEPHLVVIIP